MGAVGKDRYAEIMTEKANSVGLRVSYQYNTTVPTGRCAVMVTGKNRYINLFLVDSSFT
jgi:adenosine kinase